MKLILIQSEMVNFYVREELSGKGNRDNVRIRNETKAIFILQRTSNFVGKLTHLFLLL